MFFLHWGQRILHTKHHIRSTKDVFLYADGSGSFHTQHQLLTTSLVFDMVLDAVHFLYKWWFSTLEHKLFDYFAAVWYGVKCCPQFLQMMVFYTDSSGSYHSKHQLFDYFAERKKSCVAASRCRVVFGYTTLCPLRTNERSLLMNLVLFRTLTLSCADLTLETARRKENAWCGSQGSRLILATGLAVRLPNLDATM